jgi:hypothetical protein
MLRAPAPQLLPYLRTYFELAYLVGYSAKSDVDKLPGPPVVIPS